eukprot:COSAG02_NODE_13452_length_1393_cov_1.334621_1_plen_123_part_10
MTRGTAHVTIVGPGTTAGTRTTHAVTRSLPALRALGRRADRALAPTADPGSPRCVRRPNARTAAAGSILVLRGYRAARAAPAGGIKATLECRAAGAAHQVISRAPLAQRPAVPVKPDVIQTLS